MWCDRLVQPTVVKFNVRLLNNSLLAGAVYHSDFVSPWSPLLLSGFSSSRVGTRVHSSWWLLGWQRVKLSFLPLVALRGHTSLHSSLQTRDVSTRDTWGCASHAKSATGTGLALSLPAGSPLNWQGLGDTLLEGSLASSGSCQTSSHW